MSEFHTSPIIGMFLAKFDMKKGNIIEWQRDCDDFKNLEFKALPSGIHELNDDIINFKVTKESNEHETFRGIAYFRQNGFDEDVRKDGQIDRSLVQMYSLGLIIKHDELQTDQYASDLEYLLTKWLSDAEHNTDSFDAYYDNPQPIPSSHDSRRKMLEYLPFWSAKLGPLILTIWKSLLLKKRILVLNAPGGSFDLCNSLAFCISAIAKNATPETPYELLYTVGTIDIDQLLKLETPYIASTSDEVLTYRKELYDIIVKLPALSSIEQMIEPGIPIQLYNSEGNEIRATHHDLEVFTFFFQTLIRDAALSPQLTTQAEPLSWLQFLIDNFYFWLTAGTIKPAYYKDLNLIDEPISLDEDDMADETSHILQYFKRKSEALRTRLSELLDSSGDSLLPADLLILDLDCFSQQDHRFVEQLSRQSFDRSITVRSSNYWNLL